MVYSTNDLKGMYLKNQNIHKLPNRNSPRDNARKRCFVL